MCIVCVKPQGVAMPDSKTIQTMWQGNPDGAGLTYWRSGEDSVTINKGFMKLKQLKSVLNELNLGTDDLMVLHFRWATHGLVDPGNCHPFPLSNKIEALRAIYGQFPCAIAHNGVFGNMACHETLSDTQKFIGKILCDPAIIGNIDNPAIVELISGYCGSSSKLAILQPGRLILIGDFVKDNDTGLIYSNRGYRPYQYANTNTCHNRIDFQDDMDSDYISPSSVAIQKSCELCQDTEGLTYVEEFQLFMCGKCYEFNCTHNYDNSSNSMQE